MPCRGTGRVISKLGGETSVVACPWCDGSGMRVAGIDAQARWPQTDAQGAERQHSGGQARSDGAEAQDAPPAGEDAAKTARA